MNDNAKTDATPSWYTPPAAAPPEKAAWPAPASDASPAQLTADEWPAALAPEGWPAPAAAPTPAPQPGFTHLSSDSPAPQPGFTHLSNDAPAPQPGFTHLANDAPAPQPGFTHLSSDSPAPQPAFTHLSNPPQPTAAPAQPAPASSLGAALAPPTPLVRPMPLPRPHAAEPRPEVVAPQREFVAPQREFVAPQREFVALQPEFADPNAESAVPAVDPGAPAAAKPAYDPFHHEEAGSLIDDDGGGPGWHVRPSAPTAVASPPAPASAPSEKLAVAPVFVMPWDAKRKPSPLRRIVLLGAGLFALVGLTALVLTNVNHSAPSIQQPAVVGTLTQVDAPLLAPTLQSLDHFERSIGATNVVTGVYGSDGQPQLFVVVVQNPQLARGEPPAVLQSFLRGLPSGAGSVGWVLDPAKATTSTADGTTFECNSGPASGLDGAVLTTCAWTDPGIAGAVVDLSGQPLTDTLNEAVLARAAAVH